MPVVDLPLDKIIAPGLFRVKVDTGTKVYFQHKGVLIEGIVESYFGHMTPDTNLAQFGSIEGGAKPANVSNIGYAVAYYVPNPNYSNTPPMISVGETPYIKQVQLLDESEFFLTLDELIEYLKTTNFLKLPKDPDQDSTVGV